MYDDTINKFRLKYEQLFDKLVEVKLPTPALCQQLTLLAPSVTIYLVGGIRPQFNLLYKNSSLIRQTSLPVMM